MTRQFCDCCRNEFKDMEEYGILQVTKTLYDGITRGETVVLYKKDEYEDENPILRMMGGTTREIIRMEICIECLRKIVALREHINVLYKKGNLSM